MMTPLRLVDELNRLHEYLSLDNFELKNGLKDNPTLLLVAITDSNRTYGLEVNLKGYPESKPSMCVLEELPTRDGKKMTCSGAMHCLGTQNGRTFICHCSTWRPDTHLISLYFKGKLWLEAYEGHLQTGKPIDYYLKHQ